MPRIIEAIDQELADLEGQLTGLQARITDVRDLREQAAAIGCESSESEELREPEPAPKRTSRRTSQASSGGTSRRTSRAPKSDPDLDERVYLELKRQGQGQFVSGGPVRQALGLIHDEFRPVVERLIAAGRVDRIGKTSATRYRVREGAEKAPQIPEPARASRPSTAEQHGDAARATALASRRGGPAAGAENRRRVRELLASNGGEEMSVNQIVEGTGVNDQAVRAACKKLVGDGLVLSRPGGNGPQAGVLYRMIGADLSGAKTDTERRVLEAVKRAPVALTTSEVEINSGVRDASPVLHGLARRDVVELESPAGAFPQRWAMAGDSSLAEAA